MNLKSDETEEIDKGKLEESDSSQEEKTIAEDTKERPGEKNKKAGKENFFKKHKKLLIILAVIIVIIVLFCSLILPKIINAKMAENTVAQTYETIEKRDISNSVAVTGTVAAKERRTLSTLVANTKVVSVDVEVGDYVTKGQRICVFDSSEIEGKMANLEKQMDIAEAKSNETVTNAQVNVNKASTTMANDFVDNTTNEARLQLNYEDALKNYYNACDGYNDAKKTRDSAKTEWDNSAGPYNSAKANYDQIPDSYKAGTVSADAATKKTWDNWIKEYEYWSQIYAAKKSAYDTAASKVTQYETSIESAEKSLRTAQQNLDDANIKTDRTLVSDYTNVASAELSQSTTNLEATTTNDNNNEQMEAYQTQLDSAVITSPIDGIVTSLSVTEGDEFATSAKTEVAVVQDDSGWIVNGTVDQYDISNIKKGMIAIVKTDATGDDELEGVVTFVSPVPASSSTSSTTQSSTSSTASYPVEITLNERDDRIRIGMTAETSIVLEQAKDVLSVPYNCIEEAEDGSFYITVADNGAAGGKGQASGNKASSNGTFGRPVKDGEEADDKAKAGRFALGGKKAASDADTGNASTRKITVTKGLETDYYTEVISSELKEGMQVLVPNESESSTEMNFGGMGMGGGPGGGPMGGF